MPSSPSKSTIQIDKDTLKKLKLRAVKADMTYTDYLEKLIREAWAGEKKRTNQGQEGGKA
jgi:hypothetical protein